MFRKMRRIKQQLSPSETIQILERGTNGILSVIGDDGFPYGVPLSYVYQDGKIYIHCAKNGHKIEAIKKNNKVSFTVVDQDKVVGRELTSYYRSAIVFGVAEIINNEDEKLQSHLLLSDKYSKLYQNEIKNAIETEMHNMLMIAIDIVHMTGKEANELVRRKKMKVKIFEEIDESSKQIRKEVFVEEQGFMDEFDDVDDRATHIVLYDDKEKAIATCRIFTKDDPNVYFLGRLAVIKEQRGKRIGSYVVEEAEKCALEKGGTSISLHAQCRTKEFYEKLGYREYGNIEDEQGYPHIWMKKELKTTK